MIAMMLDVFHEFVTFVFPKPVHDLKQMMARTVEKKDHRHVSHYYLHRLNVAAAYLLLNIFIFNPIVNVAWVGRL